MVLLCHLLVVAISQAVIARLTIVGPATGAIARIFNVILIRLVIMLARLSRAARHHIVTYRFFDAGFFLDDASQQISFVINFEFYLVSGSLSCGFSHVHVVERAFFPLFLRL